MCLQPVKHRPVYKVANKSMTYSGKNSSSSVPKIAWPKQ